MSMKLKVRVGCLQPVKDMLMNKFRLFQDLSSNVSPETLMTSKNNLIDLVVRTLHEAFFPEMVEPKSSVGRVVPDLKPDTFNNDFIFVDDGNGGRAFVRRSARKRPEKVGLIRQNTQPSRNRNLKTGERLGRSLPPPITRV